MTTPPVERQLPTYLPAIGDKTPKTLIKGVVFEWLSEDGFLFTLSDVHRDAVDMYIDTAVSLLNNWDLSKPMRIISDMANENMSLTPYFRKRLNDITTTINTSQVHGVSAVVMGSGFVETLIVFFGNAFNKRTPNFKQRYFTDKTKGLDWVMKESAP